jgi:integrase
MPYLEHHLAEFVSADPESWLFPGTGNDPASPRTLDRVWSKARTAAGRPHLRLHDLRHSGLTWSAATGATIAELMHRAGHKSAGAAVHYQHATDDRDKVIADALAELATRAEVIPIADIPRTRLGESS